VGKIEDFFQFSSSSHKKTGDNSLKRVCNPATKTDSEVNQKGASAKSMNTTGSISIKVQQILESAGNQNAAFETEYILSESLECSRLDLHLNSNKEISEETANKLLDIAERRATNEPLQYIFGKAYFMNLELIVGSGVLIPRPETELLVEYVCKHAPENAEICDIGTGSGTISLSIAYERPDTQVIGVDLKPNALSYAQKNKEKYSLKNITLMKSNLFSSLPKKRFDVITANLPYISQAEYDKLEDEVKTHEPKSALYADDEGRALIAQTITEAPGYLKPNGLIIFEIGYEQGPAVAQLLINQGDYSDIKIIKDLNKLDRFVKARLKQ